MPAQKDIAFATNSTKASASVDSLSKREQQVLKLIVTGQSNPEIAKQLCRSLGTVKVHVHNIYRKLGVSNRINAINKYYQELAVQ